MKIIYIQADFDESNLIVETFNSYEDYFLDRCYAPLTLEDARGLDFNSDENNDVQHFLKLIDEGRVHSEWWIEEVIILES